MRLYIDSSHSRHFSIRYYGADVAQWISSSVSLGWERRMVAGRERIVRETRCAEQDIA
jgi:uncharacterized protein (DUF2252 family)